MISELNGQAMDWNSPAFWAEFLRATAYREGLGDVLAEGGWAAARALDMGEDAGAHAVCRAGAIQAHWDGHAGVGPPFPYWLVSALQWMSDTRDPFNSGHGSLWPQRRARACQQAGRWRGAGGRAGPDPRHRAAPLWQRGRGGPVRRLRRQGEHGPLSHLAPGDPGLRARGRLRFPLIYHARRPDGYWRLDVDGLGEIEGPSVEYHLFRAGTGLDWPEAEFERAAERVCTLERALQVRHWGRDRSTDETVLPYFERLEAVQSPFLERRYGLDREQFKPVLDEFYALHGWDPQSGWPTRERLAELGMGDVYEPMVEGAAKAKERQPRH